MNPMRMDGRRCSIWRRPAAALIAAALYFGPVPAALAGRELVYVFNTGSKDVTVIDPVSHTVVRTHPLGVSVRWLSDEQITGTAAESGPIPSRRGFPTRSSSTRAGSG